MGFPDTLSRFVRHGLCCQLCWRISSGIGDKTMSCETGLYQVTLDEKIAVSGMILSICLLSESFIQCLSGLNDNWKDFITVQLRDF